MLDVDDMENFPLLPEHKVMGRGTGLLHRKFRAQKLDFCSELSLIILNYQNYLNYNL